MPEEQESLKETGGVKRQVFTDPREALGVIKNRISYAIFNEILLGNPGRLKRERRCVSVERLILSAENNWGGQIFFDGKSEELAFPSGGAILFTIPAGVRYSIAEITGVVICLIVKGIRE